MLVRFEGDLPSDPEMTVLVAKLLPQTDEPRQGGCGARATLGGRMCGEQPAWSHAVILCDACRERNATAELAEAA